MSATTMRSDLEGLTIGHAQKLKKHSRAGVRQVEHANALLATARRAFTPLAEFLASAACWYINRQTVRMADQTVWFQGVKTYLEADGNLTASEVATGNMLAAIEGAQGSVMALREAVLPLLAQFSTQNPRSRIAHCLKRQLVALSDLFDAMEAARWAVLELEADIDIERGAIQKFDSVDDLIASLNA